MMRKAFLNAKETGLISKLKSTERDTPAKNPMTGMIIFFLKFTPF